MVSFKKYSDCTVRERNANTFYNFHFCIHATKNLFTYTLQRNTITMLLSTSLLSWAQKTYEKYNTCFTMKSGKKSICETEILKNDVYMHTWLENRLSKWNCLILWFIWHFSIPNVWRLTKLCESKRCTKTWLFLDSSFSIFLCFIIAATVLCLGLWHYSTPSSMQREEPKLSMQDTGVFVFCFLHNSELICFNFVS